MFMNAVNTMVAGTLGALVAYAVGAGPVVTSVVGVLTALAHLGAMVEWGRRTFGVDPPGAGQGRVP
jgi:hypothetical protein